MLVFLLLTVYSPSTLCTENRWIHCGAAVLVDCSQSLFFRTIVEIERFALRAAILDECQKN